MRCYRLTLCVMALYAIILPLTRSFATQESSRVFLQKNTNLITSTRQNLHAKKAFATKICTAIRDIEQPSIEDVSMLSKYLTVADPSIITKKKLVNPTLLFPAVDKLIDIGPNVAQPIVNIRFPSEMQQSQKAQLSINIVYVLVNTVGAKHGLYLINKRISDSNNNLETLSILNKSIEILELRISSDNSSKNTTNLNNNIFVSSKDINSSKTNQNLIITSEIKHNTNHQATFKSIMIICLALIAVWIVYKFCKKNY